MDEIKHQLLQSITGPIWEKIGIRHHHGINLSLSSLHSNQSCGIGEFYDLIPLIDWCKQIGFDVIQLLPLNYSKKDPSPYNAVSSCALHFIYLSLYELPYLDLAQHQKEKLKDFADLNKSQRVAYHEVLTQKLVWLRAYFDEIKEPLIKSSGFQDFIAANPWVEPYALFDTLKDHLGHTHWTAWPNEVKSPSPKKQKELIKIYWPEAIFHIALQYLCYLQLTHVRSYANKQGILLMGDLPLLVRSDSADVWEYPEYFEINLSAGSPPDAYVAEGQYWNLPLFRWDAMRKDEFSWWKQRLHYASHFFDLFRLDHVVGFFRIWAIPIGHPSKEGYFLPVDEQTWEPLGRELLKMAAGSSSMLPIGEDLGTVPSIVPPILNEMGICGTKVTRWMLDSNHRAIPIQEYPPISLTTVSTHDLPTLQEWWTTFPEESKLYAQSKNWQYTPSLTMEQQKCILWESHHTSSLFHINLLQEYLALFPDLVWPNPKDERINIPGQILPTNWTYRFRPSVETIISHEDLAKALKEIIS